MKRSVFSKTLALILCFILAFSTFAVNVFAANEDADIDMGDDVVISTLPDVYVSASGSDSNAGTEAAPFATLAKALVRVGNGGTIHIVDSYTVPADMNWIDRNVTPVTITGGTLDLSASDLVIGYNVIFKDITISGGKSVYANGNSVTFESGANATAVTVYGGNNSGEALDSTNLTIAGGNLGTVYGGGSVDCIINQVNLTVNGGTVANVIGGNNASNLIGNVTVTLNGGTVTSSIFGGCYNEYTATAGGSFLNYKHTYAWTTACYVNGKVDVIIGDGVALDISSTTNEAIFAHSRQKTLSSSEDTSIIFLSQGKYTSTESILGANDTYTDSDTWSKDNLVAGLSHEMGTDAQSSADYVHVHGLSYDNTAGTITEGCDLKAPTGGTSPCESTVATLTIDSKASLAYTGKEITPAVVNVVGTFTNGEPVLTYSNNINPGTATATMSYNGVSVSKEFTIAKAEQKAPKGLVAVPESISGIADGEIYGLTTAMEYSTDGATYTSVTDTAIKLAAGTYYVRYAETDYYNASEAATVVVEAGRMLTVTFNADGNEVAVKEVSYAATLTDIPEIPAKTGYDKTAPYWDVTDFSNITSDITVNAIYTINTYKVTYVADGVTVSEQTVNYGEDAVVPEIPVKEGYALVAPYWDGTATNVTSDLTITAVYTKDFKPGDVDNDGRVNLNDLITLAQYLAGWGVTISTVPYMG